MKLYAYRRPSESRVAPRFVTSSGRLQRVDWDGRAPAVQQSRCRSLAVLECGCWLVPPAPGNAYLVLMEPKLAEPRCKGRLRSLGVSSTMTIKNALVSDRRPRIAGSGAHRDLLLPVEASAEERAAARRSARMQIRLYCVLCGRSTIVARAPARPGRCPTCDGTMLTELDPA